MPNPTIYVTLDSLAVGTKPTVTGTIHATQGGQLDVNATWPASGSNTINCDLKFNSDSQDPMDDQMGGDTNFDMTRASSSVAAVHTLSIENDATTATPDTYDLTLTIGSNTYSTDPIIIVDDE